MDGCLALVIGEGRWGTYQSNGAPVSQIVTSSTVGWMAFGWMLGIHAPEGFCGIGSELQQRQPTYSSAQAFVLNMFESVPAPHMCITEKFEFLISLHVQYLKFCCPF